MVKNHLELILTSLFFQKFIWNKIIQTSVDPNQNKPKLLYKSEDIVEKILIDLVDEKIEVKKGRKGYVKITIPKET